MPEVLAQEQRTGAFACVLRTDPTPEERDAEEEIDLGTPMVEKSRLLKEVDFLLGNLGVLSTLEPSRSSFFSLPERQPAIVLHALHARSLTGIGLWKCTGRSTRFANCSGCEP